MTSPNWRPLASVVAALAFSAAAWADETVRVAHWNVQTCGAPASDEYEAALDVLLRIDADVVLINEVGSAADVSQCASLFTAAGYPNQVIAPGGPFGAQSQAIGSRFAIVSSAINDAATLSGDPQANDITRNIVEVVVDPGPNADDLTLISMHWKSGTADTDEFRRVVESNRIVDALGSLDPLVDSYVIAGDVNEQITDVPQNPNPFTSVPSGMPTGWQLGSDLLAELTSVGFDNDPFLYIEERGFLLTAQQLDGSFATRPSTGRRIDYLFVSDRLNALGPDTEIYDSDDEGLPGGLPKAGLPLPASTCATASDHLPVFADIVVPGGPANTPPTAVAGGPYSGTPGVAVSFDGSGSTDPDGTIESYAWTFGDGGTGTGPTPTHTYASAGLYTVTLTVTDDDAATDDDSTTAGISGGGLNHVVISQVGYDTPGTDSLEEYVDLYNPTASPVNVGGWTLTDNVSSWAIPAGTTVPANSYISVAANAAGFEALHGFVPQVTGMAISLNNTGDRVVLANGGNEVDRVAYENFEAGWTITANIGDSIERANPTIDTDSVADWVVTSPANPDGEPPPNQPPVAEAAGPYSGQAGTAVSFNGTGSTDNDGTIVSYAWDFGDGQNGSGATPSHTYATSGVFTVTLTVTDDDSAIDTDQATADIAPPPNQPPVALAAGPYAGEAGIAVSFNGAGSTDSDGTIVSYAWDFGDGQNGTGATPSHTYATSGVFTVTLTVTDDDSAIDTDGTTANIAPPNQAPVAEAAGPYSGTAGTAVSFDGAGSTDSDGTIVSYAWTFGDGGTGTGATPSHTYALAGSYTVTLTVTDDDDATGVDQAPVEIAPPPNQPPEAEANGPYSGQTGAAIAFSATGSSDSDGTIVSYEWDFGDGNTGTGSSTTHAYAAAGPYTVTLTVTDDDSAIDTDTATANVTDPPPTPKLFTTTLSGVSNQAWTDVTLPQAYTSKVVIATPAYGSGSQPLVTRVEETGASSIRVRVQRPAGDGVSATATVHVLVVEEGDYAGFEARRSTSSVTDEDDNWTGQSQSYHQAYTSPVVIGQVMSYNDAGWSVFWASRNGNRQQPPNATSLAVGKHVGADTDTSRANETLGWLVIESGLWTIDGRDCAAGVSGDSLRGVLNSPPYTISVPAGLGATSRAWLSSAGMDGADGGWPILWNPNPVTASTLRTAIDEDLPGNDRKHTTEQGAFLACED